ELLSCQITSAVPLPSTSPVPVICQLVPAEPITETPLTAPFDIVHSATWPVVPSCQITSVVPSPVTSPALAICQLVPAEPIAARPPTWPPATLPPPACP